MIKILLIFSLASSVLGGVQIATPEIEEIAKALWEAHCAGDSEGGTDGNTNSLVYCKKSKEDVEEALQHEVTLNAPEKPQDQVVFVKLPSIKYKHDVIVSGGQSQGGKTVIYVKPQVNTHEINVQDKTEAGGAPQKPTLYFLKGDHGGGGAAVGEAAADAVAPADAPADVPAPEEASAPEEAVSGGYGDAASARKRRNNVPDTLLSLPSFENLRPAPKTKTVYILRRTI